MPRLLKSETARRLLVGQRALATAFSLLATPKSVSHEPDKSDGAIEIGLIGIAAELAISAFAQSDSVGACITAVVEGKAALGDDKFPELRSLIAAASDREDIAPLARIVADNALKMVATQARKAIAEIDYVLFGPLAPKALKAI
jgi:hypothetical protein